MNLHILRCGTIRVSESVVFGGGVNLRNTARQLLAPDKDRIELPVFCYLIEHPKGLLLVDTGWPRAISPAGVYDEKAVSRLLPKHLAAFYHPSVSAGQTAREQLMAMGLRPEDLDCVILTHLDPDHVAGLKELAGAKRIVLPEDEYFWACRTVYKARQPWQLWRDAPIERLFYRGSPLGPNRWAIDLFGDESVQLVNVPGHTDGQAAVILRHGGRFVILAADAAFSPQNWREGKLPGFGFDENFQRKSLQWLAEMERDPGCAGIFCSHDADTAPHIMEF